MKHDGSHFVHTTIVDSHNHFKFVITPKFLIASGGASMGNAKATGGLILPLVIMSKI